MTAHAKLSASGSSRWLYCPGSVKAESTYNYEDRGSIHAQEGTVAHELAEKCLTTPSIKPTDFLNVAIDASLIKVNQDMCDAVQVYMDEIELHKGIRFIEKRVDFSDYAPEGFGTADCIVIDSDNKKMTIIDLKYGKGIRVDAIGNTQMRLYALGALADYGMIYDIETVEMIIVQPRLDHIESDECTVEELYKFGEWVKQQAELALSDDAPRVAGEKQCEWCKHKAVCPELLNLTQKTLMSEFDDCDPTPVNKLTDTQLRTVLDNMKLINSWLSAVEDYVKSRLEDGDDFPGYKIVEGRSSREWSDEEEAVTLLSEAFTEEELFERKFISVAKAEKLLGKANAGLIKDKVVKKAGKPTLVPESDKRLSITISAKDFD